MDSVGEALRPSVRLLRVRAGGLLQQLASHTSYPTSRDNPGQFRG
jgi:hypothetical protein